MVQAKKFIYVKRFEGLPKVTDFRLEEETLPNLDDGGKPIHLMRNFDTLVLNKVQ